MTNFAPISFDEVDGASWRKPGFDQAEDHPIVEVSWNDASAFCAWFNRKEPGRHYRLPTEAEWECAGRAGARTTYPWGNDPDEGKVPANCADPTLKAAFKEKQTLPDTPWNGFEWADGYVFTSPVAWFRPNAFGLYDIIGNTFEWCSDWFDEYPKGEAMDPTGPSRQEADKSYRVVRGGSWCDIPSLCRCAFRRGISPDDRYCVIGFRLALDF